MGLEVTIQSKSQVESCRRSRGSKCEARMPPLRLSFSIDGRSVEVTVEQVEAAPRETHPKGTVGRASESEDDVPVFLACGNEALTDEEIEYLFEEFELAMLRGKLNEILLIIETLKKQNRKDINEGLKCIKKRLLVFLNTDSGFF